MAHKARKVVIYININIYIDIYNKWQKLIKIN